jgi:hypothetical protein
MSAAKRATLSGSLITTSSVKVAEKGSARPVPLEVPIEPVLKEVVNQPAVEPESDVPDWLRSSQGDAEALALDLQRSPPDVPKTATSSKPAKKAATKAQVVETEQEEQMPKKAMTVKITENQYEALRNHAYMHRKSHQQVLEEGLALYFAKHRIDPDSVESRAPIKFY